MQRLARIVSGVLIFAFGVVAIGLFAAPKAGPAESPYVGEKKCKKCHIKQHKTWRDTKHAKAFTYLDAEAQKDPECIKCHTTGFGKGGFVSAEASGHLQNVQCEQCHGTGADHTTLMNKLKKDKVEKTEYPKEKNINRKPSGCSDCHNPHKKHKKHKEVEKK